MPLELEGTVLVSAIAEESADTKPEIVDAKEPGSEPKLDMHTALSEGPLTAATPLVAPDGAIPTVAVKQAAPGVIGQLDVTIVLPMLLVVAVASWFVRSRRHNVRDRLSDLVALRQAGLVSEQNYLEREREILQEI